MHDTCCMVLQTSLHCCSVTHTDALMRLISVRAILDGQDCSHFNSHPPLLKGETPNF